MANTLKTTASSAAKPAVTQTKPAATKKKSKDIALILGKSENGYAIVRQKDETLYAGELQPIKEGQPIQGELVSLAPRPESERLFDVNVEYTPPATERSAGPSQVSSKQYRRGWSRVFTSKDKALPS